MRPLAGASRSHFRPSSRVYGSPDPCPLGCAVGGLPDPWNRSRLLERYLLHHYTRGNAKHKRSPELVPSLGWVSAEAKLAEGRQWTPLLPWSQKWCGPQRVLNDECGGWAASQCKPRTHRRLLPIYTTHTPMFTLYYKIDPTSREEQP